MHRNSRERVVTPRKQARVITRRANGKQIQLSVHGRYIQSYPSKRRGGYRRTGKEDRRGKRILDGGRKEETAG